MRCRGWPGILLLAAWPQVAQAQAAADDSLDETQKLGRRLFGNHCVVCHEKPQITSIQYGPALSRESLGGQQGVIQDVISNGTPGCRDSSFNSTRRRSSRSPPTSRPFQ